MRPSEPVEGANNKKKTTHSIMPIQTIIAEMFLFLKSLAVTRIIYCN
jgi:hypothetical protein